MIDFVAARRSSIGSVFFTGSIETGFVTPWNFTAPRNVLLPNRTREQMMGKGLLLWLIGIPLPIILLIWLFGGLS
jgi:hypothetical protein